MGLRNIIKKFFNKCELIETNLHKKSLEKYLNKQTRKLTHYKSINYKSFWKKYDKHYTKDFHNFYYEKTGINSMLFIPDGFYYSYIDRFYNDWKLAEKIDNKCFYDVYFKGYNIPKTIAKKISGYWFYENRIISFIELLKVLNNYKELVVKISKNSLGGHGVSFVKIGEFDKIDLIGNDLVVQECIKQSIIMSKLCSSSVNTVRVLTFLNNGNIKALSTVVRFGLEGSRVDNASSGGCTVGIEPSGQLKNVGYDNNGKKYEINPNNNEKFDNVIIPNYQKIILDAIELHYKFPLFGLISWDFAIDIDDNPILIEANFSYGELTFHQLNNGPLFKTKEELLDILEKIKTK